MMFFGDSAADSATALTQGLLAKNPDPSTSDLVSFLSLLSTEEREVAERALIAGGAAPTNVLAARAEIGSKARARWKNYATIAAAGAAGFHGYRRNDSLVWGLSWFVLGTLFPIVTNVVALAQGFGQPRKA